MQSSAKSSRGRPLGLVSRAVLETVAAERPMTASQLSAALMLSRRDASWVCSKLAGAGKLMVVARIGRENVYAPPRQATARREPTWFMV